MRAYARASYASKGRRASALCGQGNPESAAAVCDGDGDGGGRTGSTPEAVLIPEYGVIHLRGCLSEHGQRELWEITKPRVTNPAGKATGFSGFSVSRKARAGRAERRDPAIDAFGALLFGPVARRWCK